MGDIGLALNREPPEVAKFFGCELGSQTSTTPDGRHIVNGSHTAQTLQGHLSKYIEKFVLCYNCHLPETHYKIKSGLIAQKCLACGHKENVDMTHKLTTFILGQHKKQKELDKKNGVTSADKKEKKKKDKAAAAAAAAAGGTTTTTATNDDDDSDDEGGEKIEKIKEKKKKDKSSNSLDTTGSGNNQNGDDDNGNSSPTSGDKPSNGTSTSGLSDLQKNGELSLSEDIEVEGDISAVEESITRFRGWFNNPANQNKSKDVIFEELRTIQTFQSLHAKYRSTIFIGAIIFNSIIDPTTTPTTPTSTATSTALTVKDISAKIIANKEYLTSLGNNSSTQRHLIAGFEYFCGVKYASLIKIFPIFLKVMFDNEILEEETILDWSKDLTRNEYSCDDSMIILEILEELREVSQPFITWLQEAEEEDEDGDDEEEDEEDED